MPADDDLSRVYTLIRAVGLTLLAGCFTEAAQPSWHLSVQTYSFHEHTDEIYLHNTTPGAGLIRRDEDWLLGAGVFRNSVGRWAGYAYTGWQPALWLTSRGPVRGGAIAGLTHHYNFNHGGIVPLGAAVLSIPVSPRLGIDLIGIPRIPNATYATLNVSVSWRLK